MFSFVGFLVAAALVQGGAPQAHVSTSQVLEPQAVKACPAKAGRIRLTGRGSPGAVGRDGGLETILLCRYHGGPFFGLGAPEDGPRHVGKLIDARRLTRGRGLVPLAHLVERLPRLDLGDPGGTVTCIGDLQQKIYMRFVYSKGPPETALALPTGCIRVEFGKSKRQYEFTHGLLNELERLLPPTKAPSGTVAEDPRLELP